MKKRAYQRTAIKDFSTSALASRAECERLVIAVDVAKRDMVAAITTERGEVLRTIAWKHPAQTSELLIKIAELRSAGFEVDAVMEASGTYGDVLRQQLQHAGLKVYLASGRRVFNSKVVHDGVSSLHDAKSAAIIAMLHAEGRTSKWTDRTEDERVLRAAVSTMDMHQVHYLRLVHQLESALARYWPEVCDVVALTSATLLAVLGRIGGPADIAAKPDATRKLMIGMSHRLMQPEKIDKVIACAIATVGLPLLPKERAALMTLADEAHRALRLYKTAKHELEKLAIDGPSQTLAPTVGITTAAVLFTEVGDPLRFPCARSYVKAFGLNLKEKSSGKHQGRLRITKCGPGRARKYLWLAVYRWRKKDPIVQAWYDAKVKRDGGSKARAVVALMRKLVRALYHVRRGEPFDSHKLFDVARLRLGARARDATRHHLQHPGRPTM